MTNSSPQSVLAFALLPPSDITIGALLQVQTNTVLKSELAWLVGAVILGYSVIARRRSHPYTSPKSTSDTDTLNGRSEQWETLGAVP